MDTEQTTKKVRKPAMSQAEIARQLGISTATVSRALNGSPNVDPDTRQKILRAMNTSRMALKRAVKNLPVIGLATLDYHPSSELGICDREVISGMMASSMQNGFALRTVDLTVERRQNEGHAETVTRLGLEGVVHFCMTKDFLPVIYEIADAGFPQCLLCHRVDRDDIAWIDTDNVEATRKAVRHLTNLGHRRIAVVTPRMDDITHADRFLGYKLALQDGGIEFDPSLHVERRDVSPDSGDSVTMELLTRKDRPTAIYYTNGESSMGAIRACTRLGIRIPQDVSLLAFSDSMLPEYLTPSVTNIRQPVFEMAYRASQYVAAQVAHQDATLLREVVAPDFFVNESTGPAPEL